MERGGSSQRPNRTESPETESGQSGEAGDAEQLSGRHLISALWWEYINNLAQSEPKSYTFEIETRKDTGVRAACHYPTQ